jgi:hypothetical protein
MALIHLGRIRFATDSGVPGVWIATRAAWQFRQAFFFESGPQQIKWDPITPHEPRSSARMQPRAQALGGVGNV